MMIHFIKIKDLAYLFIPYFLLLFIVVIPEVSAQQVKGADEIVTLWPEGPPISEGDTEKDQPDMTVFLPDESKATGTAVVVFPGGGYSHLAIQHEGYDVARWLNSIGVAAFVVKYRLGKRYHHPSQMRDAHRAIRTVRADAEKWGVQQDQIGMLGFSAGGHLASTAGTHFEEGNPNADSAPDRFTTRPNFMVLIYPVVTMQLDYTHRGSREHLLGENPDAGLVAQLSNELQVSNQTPPTFLVHGTNDRAVPVQNSLQFYNSLLDFGVPAEMHLFEDGPHGFGLAPDDPELSKWPDMCERWMRSRGLLD